VGGGGGVSPYMFLLIRWMMSIMIDLGGVSAHGL